MNNRFSDRCRSPLAVLIALVIGNHAVAQSNTAIEAQTLANAIGLTQQEKQCLQALDKKCLITFYQSDTLIGEPFHKTVYSDTISWKYMARTFQQSLARKNDVDPNVHIQTLKREAVYNVLAEASKPATIAIQNIAFRYDEQLHKYDSSLYFTNLALARWEQKKDTLNTANLYKYRAYLSSYLSRFEPGKQDARKAVILYAAKGVQKGVMVSYRDLATIFIKEKNEDSANYYLAKAKTFWLEQRDAFRIFDVNTQLIRANSNNNAVIEKLIAENDNYMIESSMPQVAANSYYNAVIDHARAVHDKDRKLKYEVKRDRLNGKKFD